MTNWAQLAKSIVASAGSLEVGVVGQGRPVGRHAMTGSGEVVFSLVEAAPACAHLVVAGTPGPDILATVADVSTLAHSGRVRGLVRLGGRAEVMSGPVDEQLREHLGVDEDALVARLVPTSIILDWRVEVERPQVVHISPEDYTAAGVDALAGWQDEWLAHLDGHHGEHLRRLLGPQVGLDASADLRPVLADQDGLVLREFHADRHRDVRIPFPRTVHCGCEAVEALSGMLATSR